MKTKICTDIEQSKRLIELGIDVNTSDMWYEIIYRKIGREDDDWDEVIEITELSEYPCIKAKAYTKIGGIPAWSLSALLTILPCPMLVQHVKDNLWECSGWIPNSSTWFGSEEIGLECGDESPLDAAFELVCWLKENNKI